MKSEFKLEEGSSTLLLVWLMLMCASMAILQSDLIEGLSIIPLMGTVAIITGLFLAKSRFPSSTAHLFSFVYGTFFLFLFIGGMIEGDLTWRERVLDILQRQVDWLAKAFGGGTSRDGLIFVIQTSAIFWLLGYTASWYTFRNQRIWRVVIPTGLVLLSVVYYYVGPQPLALYLAVYILLALIYIARTYLFEQETVWQSARVRYEKTIRGTFLRAAFIASLVALIIAWALPALPATAGGAALSANNGPWQEFQDDWTRLFASLRSYGTTTTDPYQDSLVLGGPRTVGNTPIMDVLVVKEMPYIYWQAVAHDTYVDGGWDSNTQQTTVMYPDDGVINVPFTLSREVVTQTVVNYLPNSSTLYAAPEAIGTDQQMLVNENIANNGDSLVSSLRSRFVLRQGAKYNVTSRISTADAVSLRSSSNEYPQWVTERYLQVPDSITPETIALAERLTQPYDNSFDKALAVRDYLRENITYNDQIAAPPTGVEPIHYVLFDLQEGYCNYYASAMVIMLRSQGVPARFVTGYAQGEYDEESQFYRVRASNAHSWVEVYFPQYGWIQFEPTASIPTVDRPEGGNGGDAFDALNNPQEQDIDRNDLLPEEEESNDEFLPPELPDGLDGAEVNIEEPPFWETLPIWQIVTGLFILFAVGVIFLITSELNKKVEADVEKSYVRLSSWASWLGLLFRPAHTPYERADMLGTAVPDGRSHIDNLTQQFVKKQFSPEQAHDQQFNSLNEWSGLRPVLIKQFFNNRLEQIRGFFRRRR